MHGGDFSQATSFQFLFHEATVWFDAALIFTFIQCGLVCFNPVCKRITARKISLSHLEGFHLDGITFVFSRAMAYNKLAFTFTITENNWLTFIFTSCGTTKITFYIYSQLSILFRDKNRSIILLLAGPRLQQVHFCLGLTKT